jgi:hypothetical protein
VAERAPRRSPEERLALLTDAYRSILARYEKIERLSGQQTRILRERGSLQLVNEILESKHEILREIRDEEERVTGAREWWKKARQSLPSESCRALLSLLDTISRRIERTLSLEAECRLLLGRAVAWGPAAPTVTNPSASRVAAEAYSRGGGEPR